MAGLQLRSGFTAGGSYTPLTPASASRSTAADTSIAQQAYGISGTGVSGSGPRTAAYGSMALGLTAIAALVYLWWTLPR